ncbi:MAG TPA: aldo/keto reductase [Mycobacteriales bacterium]|nr:aldo/keto reductase [Mycobacteriales bacterium]
MRDWLGDRWMRELGATGLRVSAVCLGGGPLGNLPATAGPGAAADPAADPAVELVKAVLNSPIRMIDTANGYGGGQSERRIAAGVAACGGLPADVVIATKVDPDGADYSGDRVRRSVAESIQRLGISPLPLVYLHDPESHDFATMTAPGGAVDALVGLREAGTVGHIGLAGGDVREMTRYVDLGVFEVVLIHNRWTLVDRSAGPLIEQALGGGAAVVNAAVHGGGILARPDAGLTSYGYRPAAPATLDAITRMAQVCTRHGTDLTTAALQWSLRDSRISTTIVGLTQLRTLDRTLAATQAALPEDLWDELEQLLPAPQHWLDA